MSGSPAISQAIGWVTTSPTAVEAKVRQWFAVQIRYRFEKKAMAELACKDCEVYLPLLTQHRAWSDRRKTIAVPLFPGYAFVHIDRSQQARRSVLETGGLIGFVSFGGNVMTVPQKQIEDLQLLLQQNAPFSLHPFVRAGQRVRVRGGCLHGLEGLLMQNEKGKLVISIESIQRSLAIEIQGYELELI